MTFLNSIVGRFLALVLLLSIAVPTTLFLLSIGKFEREYLESLFDRARAFSAESGYAAIISTIDTNGGGASEEILDSVNMFAALVAEDAGLNHFAIRDKRVLDGGQSVSRLHLLNSDVLSKVGTPPQPEDIIQRYNLEHTSGFEFVRRALMRIFEPGEGYVLVTAPCDLIDDMYEPGQCVFDISTPYGKARSASLDFSLTLLKQTAYVIIGMILICVILLRLVVTSALNTLARDISEFSRSLDSSRFRARNFDNPDFQRLHTSLARLVKRLDSLMAPRLQRRGVVHDIANLMQDQLFAIDRLPDNDPEMRTAKQRVHEIQNMIIEKIETVLRERDGPTLESCPVSCLVDDAIATVAERAAEAGIGFKHDVDPSMTALVDRALFTSCLSNLLTNSINALKSCEGKGGEIAVAAQDADDHVEITVTDNGPGIAEHKKSDLFSWKPTAPDMDGHGIGLPHARRNVRLIGGDLELLGSAIGAKFRITLNKTAA